MERMMVLKIVVAGDGAVGKTSLIRRYCEGKFEHTRVQTIGVDFQTQTVKLPQQTVKLSIWDMAGQDRFAVVRAGFYRGSRAAALVFDVTEPETLKDLLRWKDEVLDAVHEQPFLVIGNKIDLERVIPTEEGKAFAESINAPYVETSALTGEGVPVMFETMAKLALGQEDR
jgi:small GTP-binding protein